MLYIFQITLEALDTLKVGLTPSNFVYLWSVMSPLGDVSHHLKVPNIS